MRGVADQGTEWWHGRIHDGGNLPCGRSRKRSAPECKCEEPCPIEGQRTQLLTGIEENAATATHNGFPAWRVVEDVRTTQPRRKVVPRGVPQRRALRRQCPSAQARPLNRIGSQSSCRTRRGVHLPTQPQGKAYTLR